MSFVTFVINDTFNLKYLFKLTITDLKGECGGGTTPFPSPKNQISWTNPPPPLLVHGLSTAPLPLAASENCYLNNAVTLCVLSGFFCWLFGQVCGRRPVAAITGRTIGGTTVTDTTTATPLMCKYLL